MTRRSLRFVTTSLYLTVLMTGSGCSNDDTSLRDDGASSGGQGQQQSGSGGAVGSGDSSNTTERKDPWKALQTGVFVHLFEWPWPDIAAECEEVLGPAGYSAVQVSPPNEHWARTTDPPWWERYQPVSYQLQSRSGTREEFVDMVNRCAASGVEIYVDAVINHMSAQPNGTGSAGTKFSKYSYPDVWTIDDFRTPPCDIEANDYTDDAQRVQECELLGLSDLNTGQDNVRRGLANYLLNLVELGVAGFRIDAAKHMAATDIQAILDVVAQKADAAPFVFLEVIQGADEAIRTEDYLPVSLGDGLPVSITDFGYASFAHQFLLPSSIGSLESLSNESWQLPPDDRSVVFTDNHDTQRGDSISYRDGKSHELANLFLLAHPHGYPKIMSSYSFTAGSGRDDGPPSNAEFATVGPYHEEGGGCILSADASSFDANGLTTLEDGRWICEHRNPAIRKMIRFRKNTAGTRLVHPWGKGASVAFGREGKGFIAINQESETLSESFQTGLPSGDYCNIVAPKKSCDDASRVSVDATGVAQLVLPPQSAWVALVESP